jgi:hypothetical protein
MTEEFAGPITNTDLAIKDWAERLGLQVEIVYPKGRRVPRYGFRAGPHPLFTAIGPEMARAYLYGYEAGVWLGKSRA